MRQSVGVLSFTFITGAGLLIVFGLMTWLIISNNVCDPALVTCNVDDVVEVETRIWGVLMLVGGGILLFLVLTLTQVREMHKDMMMLLELQTQQIERTNKALAAIYKQSEQNRPK